VKLTNLYRLFVLDENEIFFINFAKKNWQAQKDNNGILLIETMKHHPYIFQIGYLSNFLAHKFQLDIRSVVNSFDYKNIWINKFFNKYLTTTKLFNSFGAPNSLNYYSLSGAETRACKEVAIDIFNTIETKADLLSVRIDGIAVGDLIYDSHLRMYKLAAVDINDPRLKKTIYDAHIISASCKKYLNKNNVKMLVMLHAVYIQHGILVRHALSKNIPTYIYGYREGRLLQKLSKEHFYQSMNHHKYRAIFSNLPNKRIALEKARKSLDDRFLGVIDPGISYMRKSSYGDYDKSNKIFNESKRQRVVIFLHCFFDSPHIYKDMLFNDFYEWLDFTLEVASNSNYDCYVKPHPNGLVGNEEIENHFINKFKKVKFLDKSISNRKLISEGFDLGVTLYGTIAHELAYHAIPVLASGDNPHANYSFCYQSKTLEDYKKKLSEPSLVPNNIVKAEVEQFFYMHYIYHADVFLKVKGNWSKVLEKNESKDSRVLASLVSAAETHEFNELDHYFEKMICHLN